ncbi:probable vacuolar amino acid transporter YPQ1 isoform X2 [Hevea brasiliensis]|uniref:probable vacuolar amino acid transporter YPQ1 isoform X2 n=1 Tax=Hevea brasiliensis TaxID=3981 RepID=UPI0025E3BB19|nr:probable vacuolar amino acid transporter YPQ1 isoform X2 [Hevea brasiliensis]
MSLAYCVKEQKPCVHWVDKYFKDCLCNLKDEFSFAFGLISLVCWGVAEIPQIITNFRTKSSHGVSLLFLLTWVAGDVFNLVGCLLEPATLYTTSTVVLVLQGFYYDHIYRRWEWQRADADQQVEDEKKPLKPKLADSAIPIPNASPRATPRREYYYTSARSMASSGTPPFRGYLGNARSGPSAMVLDNESSSDDDAAPVSAKSVSQPRPIPRSAGYGTFLATSVNLPLKSKALTDAYIGFNGRRLLHEGSGTDHNAFGQWLGWLMAAIYMGGRIPQIWLNIKRGSVEGLNPLMFIFALVANLTYVLSILVRTTEWDKIKANMPWLLDAIVCVALDLFIILQYIYYRYIHQEKISHEEDYGDYLDSNKASLS